MDIGHDEHSQTAKLIWLIGTPIIFVVGMVGNGITLAVFLNPKTTKSSSTSVFFIWLAFADALVLLVELPRMWIVYIYRYDIRHYSDLACKLHLFGVFYPTSVSSYVLLALTVERLISAVRPHQMKIICTPKSAHAVCLGIVVFVMLLSGIAAYGYGLSYLSPPGNNETLTNPANTTHCADTVDGCSSTGTDVNSFDTSSLALNRQPDEMTTVSLEVDAALSSEKAMCYWYPDEKSAIAKAMDDMLQFFFGFLFVEIAMGIADIIIIYKLTSIEKQRSCSSKQSGHIRQITITLVSVNVVYIVCRTPLFVYLSFILPRLTDATPQAIEEYWAIVCAFFFTNHAANFFLYVLIGQRFRKQVIDLLCGWRKQNVDTSVNTRSDTT